MGASRSPRQTRFKYIPFRSGERFRRLFEEWHEILKWYEENESTDLPYWYLERTNIGHLALAAYQRSCYPLQEFTCKKGRGASRSNGRADLYIYVPVSRNGNSYDVNIEAKQVWCALSLGRQSEGTIQNGLKKAEDDCGKLKDKAWRAKHRLGLLFVLPYKENPDDLKANVLRHDLRDFTKQIERIAKPLHASFVAIHYADINVSKRIYEKNAKDGWCPGIAVIGKLVD